MPLILLPVQIMACMCTKRDLIHRTVLQKCGRDNNCSLAYGSYVENSNIRQSKPKIVQSFGGYFNQIKVRQPIGRKYSIQTVIRTSRRLDSFLYEAAQNFFFYLFISINSGIFITRLYI